MFFYRPLTHGCASVSQPARTYLPQLCVDKGCSLEDLSRVMIGTERKSQGVMIETDGERERESRKYMLSA